MNLRCIIRPSRAKQWKRMSQRNTVCAEDKLLGGYNRMMTYQKGLKHLWVIFRKWGCHLICITSQSVHLRLSGNSRSRLGSLLNLEDSCNQLWAKAKILRSFKLSSLESLVFWCSLTTICSCNSFKKLMLIDHSLSLSNASVLLPVYYGKTDSCGRALASMTIRQKINCTFIKKAGRLTGFFGVCRM